ncbi:MAG: hypothetical protein D6731_15565 [Planctomycetota bacterium]|nr:MAG: hypothetical protein D6731_15565 [Planctomycetota bacterium]
MLAMIEINLLPPEYRPGDKTSLPLLLTIAVGMVVVGSITLWGLDLNRQLGKLKSEASDLQKEKASLEADVQKVKQIERKIARQRARQDTIIAISQSKVMWSLKLQQLSQIMSRFPNFWVKSMVLTKGRKNRALKLTVSATGSNLSEVARFRNALKEDPNFFYHFDKLESYDVRIVELSERMNFSEKMDFVINLPLKSVEGKKRKGR